LNESQKKQDLEDYLRYKANIIDEMKAFLQGSRDLRKVFSEVRQPVVKRREILKDNISQQKKLNDVLSEFSTGTADVNSSIQLYKEFSEKNNSLFTELLAQVHLVN